MSFGDALTTDISIREIVMAGGAGAVMGATFGLVTGVAATGAAAGTFAGPIAAGIVSSPATGVSAIGGSFAVNLDASPILNFEANIGLEVVWNGASSELSAFGLWVGM